MSAITDVSYRKYNFEETFAAHFFNVEGVKSWEKETLSADFLFLMYSYLLLVFPQ